MIKDRTVARSHVIAWRKHLESHNLSDASIRRKLSALSILGFLANYTFRDVRQKN
jgi:hypothetical protein